MNPVLFLIKKMKERIILTIIFVFALLLICFNASAHPHVWIDYKLIFEFDDAGLAGIHMEWLFDPMFSNMIYEDFDSNNDGKFSDSEIKDVNDNIFINLKDYNYFTSIYIDKKEFEVQFVKGFKVTASEDRVIFKFFIPCHVTAASNYKNVMVSVYDKTIYTDLAFSKENPQ